MIGEDPDLEKSGRILYRVIAWNRDGITIEADQRHVREILNGFELERAITLRHHVPWRGRMKARESTNEDRDRSRLSTSGTAWTTGTDR